ncbi:MAG: hypothetical protein WAU56_18785 [Steroidobacteraceae bacterium]
MNARCVVRFAWTTQQRKLKVRGVGSHEVRFIFTRADTSKVCDNGRPRR